MVSSGHDSRTYEPECWELQYESYRYLSRIADRDLSGRYEGVVRNMYALISADRHVIPIQSFLSSWYWYRKEHLTRLEFELRGIPLPVTPPSEALDNRAYDAPARPSSPNAGDVLFRYGKLEHMQDFFEKGVVRIGPASYYKSLEGDIARADDEVTKESFLPGQYSRITTRAGQDIPVIGDIRHSVSFKDYYLLCMACDWDPMLFNEFGNADACVIIQGVETFAKRLELATQVQLPNWDFHHFPVEYFDPYEGTRKQVIHPPIYKDFRFAYQREYRFFWISPSEQPTDGFKFLQLGPLQDIAQLSVLN